MSLATLVVNLIARTDVFERNINRSRDSLREFASSATRMERTISGVMKLGGVTLLADRMLDAAMRNRDAADAALTGWQATGDELLHLIPIVDTVYSKTEKLIDLMYGSGLGVEKSEIAKRFEKSGEDIAKAIRSSFNESLIPADRKKEYDAGVLLEKQFADAERYRTLMASVIGVDRAVKSATELKQLAWQTYKETMGRVQEEREDLRLKNTYEELEAYFQEKDRLQEMDERQTRQWLESQQRAYLSLADSLREPFEEIFDWSEQLLKWVELGIIDLEEYYDTMNRLLDRYETGGEIPKLLRSENALEYNPAAVSVSGLSIGSGGDIGRNIASIATSSQQTAQGVKDFNKLVVR